LAVVRALRPEVEALDCGEVPESYLDEIRRRAPDCLLIVDAVDFGARPGSAVVLDREQLLRKPSINTHRPSLGVLADYVRAEMGADAVLLGIQPRTVEWGAALSAEVSQAAQALARWLSNWLGAEVGGDT
jgi:hydrogenase 3 maturation protease